MAEKKAELNSRNTAFEIQSQCYHNGVAVWTEEIVQDFIDRLEANKDNPKEPTLEHWAWCKHDKDIYRQENIDFMREIDPDFTAEVGSKRPAHIHLMMKFKNSVSRSHLQKLCGLDIHFVRPPSSKRKAKYQYMDMITYLSHRRETEQIKGKHIYTTEEIHCEDGFDYDKEVAKHLEWVHSQEAKKRATPHRYAEDMINKVESGELSFAEAKEQIMNKEGFAFFLKIEKELQQARLEYVQQHFEMQPRANYYIYGCSGSGKSSLSTYLARALFPGLPDSECFFTAGAKGVRFDGYEQQPVIIWEDVRGEELLAEYGKENLLNLMEINPKKRSYSVKFGRVILTNRVNIFTGPFIFETFAEALMASKKSEAKDDIEQVYRRFPVVIEISTTMINIRRNLRLFLDGNNKSIFQDDSRIYYVNIPDLFSDSTGESLIAAFDGITKPIVKLYDEFKIRQSSKQKHSSRKDAPKRMKTVSLRDNETEDTTLVDDYHKFCTDFLEHHMLGKGEYGPYYPEPGWRLGKILEDGPCKGLYCPCTHEQWIDMGFAVVDRLTRRPVSRRLEDDLAAFDRHIRLGENPEAEAQTCVDTINKGDKPQWPDGVSKQDNDVAMATKCPGCDDKDDDESSPCASESDIVCDSDMEEVATEFIDTIAKATALFQKEKTEDALREWIITLTGDDAFDLIYDDKYPIVRDRIKRRWHKVRKESISAGLAKDEKSWYLLFQKLNIRKEEDEGTQ